MADMRKNLMNDESDSRKEVRDLESKLQVVRQDLKMAEEREAELRERFHAERAELDEKQQQAIYNYENMLVKVNFFAISEIACGLMFFLAIFATFCFIFRSCKFNLWFLFTNYSISLWFIRYSN